MVTPMMVTTTPAHMVVIGGVQTRVTSISTGHDVDRGVGTCTIRMPALFSWVTVGANVSVQLGYTETGTHPVFIGTVRNVDRAFAGDGGWELVVTCDGQLNRLVDGEEQDIQFSRMYMGDLARSITAMRGVGPLIVDRIKSPVDWELDANWIFLGGNENVDDGMVVIRRRQGLYSFLDQKLRLFGYRIFDRPSQDVRIARIYGVPSGRVVHTATEGVDIFRGNHTKTNDQVNYWTVEGSSYTDADGIPVKFRSIPASVPYDPRLRPMGYRADDVSDGLLSSQFLVDTVRQIHELIYSEPTERTSWEMPGSPLIQPGDVIEITSEILGHETTRLWVMSVRHNYSDQGFWTNIEAWAGYGVALPHGSDEVTIQVVTNPVHVGDEYVPWYAQPNPSGKEVRFDIDIPDEYTAIVMEWWSHGSNSYFLDGASSESTVSTITVEQGGEEVGSADLPMQPEEYEKQRPYGAGLTYWGFNRQPIPGRLKPGRATVRFKSGEDNRLPWATRWDDFEIRDVVLKLTGVGQPELPTPRG